MAHLIVLAETDGVRILPTTGPTLTFAQEWARETGGTFDLLLLLGPEPAVPDPAQEWRGYGAAEVILCQRHAYTHPVADQVAACCVDVMQQRGAASLAGPASSFGRDVLPRVAGLLDLPMGSDVMEVRQTEGGVGCRCPMYAGQAIASVAVAGDAAVYSVRGASYGNPEQVEAVSPVRALDIAPDALPPQAVWVNREEADHTRPDLATARVVVAGGRPLHDAETFERLVGGLADALGGAVGATGGAVGAGLAPAELLIGQTGQTVAPDLYIAAGVSGSDQHVAGMRDSRVIVVINTDAQADMFQIADYGLIADVHQALPALRGALQSP